jgi:Na+/melibiose symporter-like transporter
MAAVAQASSGARTSAYYLFGSFALPFMIMQGPGLAILPNLYAERFHFDLARLGVTLLVVRLVFDALLNPIVGLCSDRTESRCRPAPRRCY